MDRYLVYIEDSEVTWAEIMTADDVFRRMDMADCSGEHVAGIFLLHMPDAPIRCTFHGKWHDLDNPLMMEICMGQDTLALGYGTDH